MNKRAVAIGEKIVKKVYENGGHWVELNMKNGDKLYIQRANFQSFEDLDREKFNVRRNDKKVLSQVSLESLSKYIDANFK